MNEQEEKRYKRFKLGMKIAGLILIAGGLALLIAGFIDLATAEGMPRRFWCLIAGFPCFAFGIMLTMAGFRREIARFAAREHAPVVNELSKEIRPGIQSIASAAAEGLKASVCPACGAANGENARFCDQCGAALVKICPACKAENGQDAKFCNSCGAKL